MPMMMPISHATWQILRALKRSKKPPTGREVRVSPTRFTKDGTFLDKLVEDGLIEVVSRDELPKNATPNEKLAPVQFRTRYRLSEKGQYAAEYGEYERELRRPTK